MGRDPVQATVLPDLGSGEGRAWLAGDGPSQVTPLSPKLVPVTVGGPGAYSAPAHWPPAPALSAQAFLLTAAQLSLPHLALSTPRQARAPLPGTRRPSPGPDPLPAATLESRRSAGGWFAQGRPREERAFGRSWAMRELDVGKGGLRTVYWEAQFCLGRNAPMGPSAKSGEA